MRNTWKIALAFTLVLGLRGAAAQAQPLIAGNTSAFGCGPIYTSDFTQGTALHSFIPTGAGGPGCVPPTPPADTPNGRGIAIGGGEIFYTELTCEGVTPPCLTGFGPTDKIRVVPFNGGDGGADARAITDSRATLTLPNPRPGSGIQDLTFASGILYVLTGYDTQVPIVYGISLLDGALIKAGVTIAQPSGTDKGVDGFAVLPNGNFLMNHGDASCIYNQYSSVDGSLVAGTTINVPGGECTGVDTDGTSLYFLTDFDSITRTDLTGAMTGFNFFSGGGDILTEDISLIHPVTIIVDAGPGNLFFTLKNVDDVNTNFDIATELLLNDAVIGTGLTRCVPSSGPAGTFIGRNIPGHSVTVPTTLSSSPLLVSGDVLSYKVYARIGTDPDSFDGLCHGPFGFHAAATGLRFIYDSTGSPSQMSLEILPSPPQTLYLRSDGTTCTNALGNSQIDATLTRTLGSVAPVAASPHCKEVGTLDGRFGNPLTLFSTWFLPPQL